MNEVKEKTKTQEKTINKEIRGKELVEFVTSKGIYNKKVSEDFSSNQDIKK